MRAFMRATLVAFAFSAAFAEAAPFAYVSTASEVTIVDTATLAATGHVVLTGTTPKAAAITPDATHVYAATSVVSSPGKAWQMNAAGGISGFFTIGAFPVAAGYDPQLNRLYLINELGQLEAYDLTIVAPIGSVSAADSLLLPQGLQVNPDTTAAARVYVAAGHLVTAYDASLSPLASIVVPFGASGIAVNRAGTTLYVATGAGVSVISTVTNTVVGSIADAGIAFGAVVLNHAEDTVYLARQGDSVVKGYDVATGLLVMSVDMGGSPAGIDIDPDDALLYVPDNSNSRIAVIKTVSPFTVTYIPSGTLPSAPGRFIGNAVPRQPTGVSATAGLASASVSFTAPRFDGGAAITSYTATCGTQSASGTGSPLVVTGLVVGTPVTCTVTATNIVGTGAASLPSNSVTPATVPDPPTAVAAVPGDTIVTVSFSPPAFDGDSPITLYTALCGTHSASGAGSPIVVTGMQNFVAASCVVTATNAVGTSLPSAPSNIVTPAQVPGAPTAVSAVAGDAQATVSFAAPASDGGSPITSYIARCGTQSAPGSLPSIVVSGLTNGVSVTCSVAAVNAIGEGPSATASSAVTPAGLPGAPTGVSAVPGNGQATVSFTPPLSNGGSPILSYTATCGTHSTPGASPPLIVAGLANGTTVSCSVRATNAQGVGPASTAVSVTPAGVPGAPSGVSAAAGNTQIMVSFSPPGSNGGSAITSYTARCGAQSASGSASPLIVSGLANGTPVACTVVATNAIGAGPASAPSNTVTPAPRSFTGPVATGLGDATVTITGGGFACNFASQGTGAAQSAFFIPVTGNAKSPPLGTAPASFPFGLLDFVLLGCDAGSTVSFSITYPVQIPPGAQYWKYGPTAAQPSPHWYVLPVTVSGNTVAFTITDGGLGDDDLTANGVVADQGGPGVGGAATIEQIPTLSQWAVIALAVLLAMSGMAMGPGRTSRTAPK